MNFRRLRAIARKEVLHIIRDPRSLASALAMPLIMLLIFGYALSLDVDRIPTIVYNMDRTPESAELVRDFRGSRYFRRHRRGQRLRAIERAMDSRRALMGVVIPRGLLAQSAGRRQEAHVQILLDGSDSNTASIALGYAEGDCARVTPRACAATRKSCAAAEVPPVGVSADTASGTTPTWCRGISSCPD